MEMLQQPTVQALAKALLHFLWQGAALALALHVVIRVWRPRADVRYILGVACLATMMLAPLATTAIVRSGQLVAPATTNAATDATLRLVTTSFATPIAPAGTAWTVRAAVVCAWLVGVSILSLRLLGGWLLTRRLVGRARNLAAPEVFAIARRVADRLALTRIVGLVESPTIAVPMMIGWIAPVVILPTAALAGLTPMQIEALLAHELAHVRRHDYLVNILQSVVETLLFYHPAVWWVSRDVRESREHCCDDLAVAVCDRVVYASALADLAALASTPRFALAATDGSLVARVRRILGGGDDVRHARSVWLPAVVLALLVASAMPFALGPAHVRAAAESERNTQAPPAAVPLSPSITLELPADVRQKPDAGRITLTADPKLSIQEDQIGLARIKDDEVGREKLERELALMEAEVSAGQGDPQRLAELNAAIDKLRQLLGERDAMRKDINRKADVDEIQLKLKMLEREIEQSGSVEKLQGEKMKTLDLDLAAMEKLNDARRREVEDVLAKREAAARTAGEDSTAENLAKLKTQLYDGAYTEKMATSDMKVEYDTGKAMLVFGAMGKGAADFDPKEMQSVIAPAFDAGPNDVSVVGRSVNHPGRVEWHDGLTVEAALKAAGAPPVTSSDFLVRRLSAMQVTFGAGGPHVSGRVDDVTASTTLRPGDVIIVSPRTRK